jgi:hypothetical protein
MDIEEALADAINETASKRMGFVAQQGGLVNW